MHYICDSEFNVIEVEDILEWAAWMETANRRVLLTEFEGCRVSTVFLGVDHNWGSGPPILFETMIFGKDELNENQWRAVTVKKARENHHKACKLVGIQI